MSTWRLTDGTEPVDGPEDFPVVPIESEEQLLEELQRLRNRAPGIFSLNKTPQGGLQMGLGGPLAGIKWFNPANLKQSRTVLADRPLTCHRVDFAAEGDTLAYWPDELIPVAQAIEIIVHFYKTEQLPNWVNWKEWDAKAMKWRTRAEMLAPKADTTGSIPTPSIPERIVHMFCLNCKAVLLPPRPGEVEQVCPHCGAQMKVSKTA